MPRPHPRGEGEIAAGGAIRSGGPQLARVQSRTKLFLAKFDAMSARKPTALKILDGDQPCRINRREPRSPKGLGKPPSWLSEEELRAWEYFVEIVPAAVLTRADRLYAEMFVQAYTDLNRERSLPHPHPPTVTSYRKQVMQILGKFGMNPSDRAGIDSGQPKGPSALAAFVMNRGKQTEDPEAS